MDVCLRFFVGRIPRFTGRQCVRIKDAPGKARPGSPNVLDRLSTGQRSHNDADERHTGLTAIAKTRCACSRPKGKPRAHASVSTSRQTRELVSLVAGSICTGFFSGRGGSDDVWRAATGCAAEDRGSGGIFDGRSGPIRLCSILFMFA